MMIKTKAQCDSFLKDILNSEEQYIGVDAETEPFSKIKTLPTDLELKGVGIFVNKKIKGYILPFLFNTDFQEVFEKKKILFHNAKFDLVFLEKKGIKLDRIKFYDTMIMSWLCNENRNSFRLKDLAESILLVKKATRFKELEKEPEKCDFNVLLGSSYQQALEQWQEKMGNYCLKDCEYTCKLFFKFKEKIEKEGLWKEFEELEMPFVMVLYEMEKRGVRIDVSCLQEVGRKLECAIVETLSEIYKEVGREIDVGSPKQLREYLFAEKKYSLPENYKTPKGAMSTDYSALEYLAKKKKCKVAENILRYRELSKLDSTYVKGMLDRVREGIIHTNFKQIGTCTGRLSSSQPNLQNIPVRDDEFNIRKAFIPREGYAFISADYSQIELRLLAYFSKDEKMLDVYRNRGDIHQVTADEIGCDRATAKAVNFGLNYGRSAYGLAEGLSISFQEAQKFIDKYFAKYPRVKIFMEQAKNAVRKHYAVKTLLKRKRRFPEYAEARKKKDYTIMRRIERQGMNASVQGSAADVIKLAMRNLFPLLKKFDSHILLQIHDELLIETPKDKAEIVKDIVKYQMENCINLKTVKLEVTPKITNVWGK